MRQSRRYGGFSGRGRWLSSGFQQTPRTRESTIQLLKTMLPDTYQKNIAIVLNDSANQFHSLLNSIDNPEYKNEQIDTIKLILQIIIKASNEQLAKQSYITVLKSMMKTQFCTNLLDNLINLELFQTNDLIDWKLIILLAKYFSINLQILPSFSLDNIGARISNFMGYLNQPNLVIPELYKDEVLTELEQLRVLQNCVIEESVNRNKKPKKKMLQLDDELNPPDNFRDLPIFPNSRSLLEVHKKDVFIRRNKSHGTYKSVDDYLDVQFRLMHEDFIHPLREGLACLMNYDDIKSCKQFNIRVYKNISLINSLPIERLGILHTLQFDVSKLSYVNWSHTKRLAHGSLLILSSDNFETLLFCTVSDNVIDFLKRGLLIVKFINSKPAYNLKYTMIESVNMYESYRHVLKRLQSITSDTLCMKDYLVFGQTNIKKPLYMRENEDRVYRIGSLRIEPGNDEFEWPTPDSLGMDDPQYEAFKCGLTKELAIIQGPPGTGKTYIGLKLCESFLTNLVKKIESFGPILIVCYTNHALDQFLEEICSFTENIIRIGSRSTSKKLEKYLIKHRRSKWSLPYDTRLRDIKTLTKNYLILQAATKASYINFIQLTRYLSLQQKSYLQDVGLNNWLNGTDNVSSSETINAVLNSIVNKWCISISDQNMRKLAREAYYECKDNLTKQNQKLKTNVERMTDKLNEMMSIENLETIYDDKSSSALGEFKLYRPKTLRSLFKNNLKRTEVIDKHEADKLGDNLAKLSMDKRWSLYRYWRQLFIEDSIKELDKIEEKLELKSVELQEVNYEMDLEIMSNTHVIGMTTTGAARYGDVLEKLQCKIIIVEEAAEVLESHIIGSLSRGCQHLVLIGDHKQLRPNPAVYELSNTYNLDLSLFERLINNGISYQTLELQHRMRPEISKLMLYIYDNYRDHSNVLQYPNVPGISHNLYFFNHSAPESFNSEIMSYSNKFEAEFVVKFCQYLIKNAIEPDKITILTLYTGQLFVMRNLQNLNSSLSNVRITSVDNYQGEENDIIILSLVRSNTDGSVGFLKVENRICVSLSRAKHGLYIFGNADMFSSQHLDKLWTKIILDLRNRDLFGTSLKIYCQNHRDKILQRIGKLTDFDLYPEGGCDQICNKQLNCGHNCQLFCHILDPNHDNYKCQQNCLKSCNKCGTICTDLCFEQCSPCQKLVEKIIPGCNHEQLVPCSLELTFSYCKVKCQQLLSCGHICKGDCYSCLHKGHLHVECKEQCNRILRCGHQCKGVCSEMCTVSCNELCEFGCVHKYCFANCGDDNCTDCLQNCEWKCPHKKCTKLCFQLCNRDICDEKCTNTKLICYKCKKIFPCYGICGEECRQICKICDKSGMLDQYFGDENVNDARFITLWTCGHSFEVTAMDKYMKQKTDNSMIITKTCPRCNTMINQRSCYRYANIIKQLQLDLKISRNIVRTNKGIANIDKIKSLHKKLHYLLHDVKLSTTFLNYYKNNKYDLVRNDVIKLSISLKLARITKSLVTKQWRSEHEYLNQCLYNLLNWLNPLRRKFDQEDLNQFFMEINRIKLLKYLQSEASMKEIYNAFKYEYSPKLSFSRRYKWFVESGMIKQGELEPVSNFEVISSTKFLKDNMDESAYQ